MIDLKSIIKRCFEGYSVEPYFSRNENAIHNFLNMNVPVYKDTFEIPVFLLEKLSLSNSPITSGMIDSFTVRLNNIGAKSTYKSLPSKIRDVLNRKFKSIRLIKIPLDTQGDNYYYGTCGAIFNKDFLPIMMMSWRIEKFQQDDAERPFIYKFVQPILRVSPSVFTTKGDSITRHVINQVIPNALDCRCNNPMVYDNPLFDNKYNYFNVKVDIDNFPFSFSKVCAPSVSTTNEELLSVALDHIDEVVE